MGSLTPACPCPSRHSSSPAAAGLSARTRSEGQPQSAVARPQHLDLLFFALFHAMATGLGKVVTGIRSCAALVESSLAHLKWMNQRC